MKRVMSSCMIIVLIANLYGMHPEQRQDAQHVLIDEEMVNRLRVISDTQDFFQAAMQGNIARVRSLIERNGINPNVRGAHDCTALHCAVQANHLNVVLYLLEKGADKDALTNDNNTPLHFAALKGHFDLVQKLKARGANIGVRNKGGELPADVARGNNHTAIVQLLEQEEPMALDQSGEAMVVENFQ